jgi:hypothetical protein
LVMMQSIRDMKACRGVWHIMICGHAGATQKVVLWRTDP